MKNGRSIVKTILFPLGIALFGVLFTMEIYIQLLGDRRSMIEAEFRFDAAQRAEIIEDAFSGLIDDLDAVGRFFEGSDRVEHEVFASFVAPWVTEGQFSAIIWAIPGDGADWIYPDRPYSLDIIYKVPTLASGEEYGRLLSLPAVKEAIARSAIRGLLTASAMFELPWNTSQPGVVLCRPVFNVADDAGHRRYGVIVGLLSLRDIATSAIYMTPPVGLPTRIRDIGKDGKGLFYDYTARAGKPIEQGRPFSNLLYTVELPFVDRTWLIEVRASTAYATKRDRSILYSSLLGGIAALTLSLVVFLLARGKSRAEAQVEVQGVELERFFTTSLDLFAILGTDGTFHRLNPRWEETLGYPHAKLHGKRLVDFIHPEDKAATEEAIAKLTGGGGSDDLVNRFRSSDGSYRNIEWKVSFSSGNDTVFAAARDITGRIEMEDALRGSLGEKEALLKEVHHRVKNNMQVISSLLDLEAMKTDEPGFLKAAKDAQNRIRSMAMIHEQLYRQVSMTNVDLGEYVHSLGAHLIDEFASVPADMTVDIKDIRLDLDDAIPCGLILNELVTNALKHAHREGSELSIRASTALDGGFCVMRIEDDGPGLPEGAMESSVAGATLGLGLVAGLADQMHGELRILPGPGARFELRFPYPRKV